MSDQNYYKDQPIPPRPSGGEMDASGHAGKIPGAARNAGKTSGAAWNAGNPSGAARNAGKTSGAAWNAGKKTGAVKGEYWKKQEEAKNRRSQERNVSPTRFLGRSPWNYITPEELFSIFQDDPGHSSGTPGNNGAAGGDVPLPEKITQLGEMLAPYQYVFDKKCDAFLRQARFMETYEADADSKGEAISFSQESFPPRHFLPSYQELTLYELKTYFLWRTEVRRLLKSGEEDARAWPAACPDFAQILLYELFNGVGAASREDAFDEILHLNRIYKGSAAWPSSQIIWWIRDFILCYEIHSEEAEAYFQELTMPLRTMETLLDPAHASDQEILAAVDKYSSYHLNRSKLREHYPEETEKICAAVVRALSEHYKEKDQMPEALALRIFGPADRWPHRFFRGALIDPLKIENHQYICSPALRYTFLNGICYRESYSVELSSSGRAALGTLIRETDRRLRIALNFRHPLKENEINPEAAEVIQRQIDLFLAAKKERERPVLQVDFGRLSDIRADSEYTAGQLLKGIEPEEEGPEVIFGSAPERAENVPEMTFGSVAEPEKESPDGYGPGLTEEEYRVLKMLLSGVDARPYLKSRNLIPSVLFDSINEKFYDEIGDSVLEEGPDGPEVIEDYREDLEVFLRD